MLPSSGRETGESGLETSAMKEESVQKLAVMMAISVALALSVGSQAMAKGRKGAAHGPNCEAKCAHVLNFSKGQCLTKCNAKRSGR
jgi:hypothetical protein